MSHTLRTSEFSFARHVVKPRPINRIHLSTWRAVARPRRSGPLSQIILVYSWVVFAELQLVLFLYGMQLWSVF